MYRFEISFAAAFLAALLLTPVARRLALRFEAVDRPDGVRKLQSHPVPLWGGVAVFLAFAIGLAVAAFNSPLDDARLVDLARTLVAAAGFVCLMGCVDDSYDLRPRVKLALQICATLPIVAAGYYVERVVAFGIPIELGWLGIPLTVAWLVGCINALNLLDGMDGLAAVVGGSTAAMMALIAASTGHDHVALIAVVFAGALGGFLIFNLPPASIYLGDSGSMVIGLVVGILGMQGALKTSATLAITAPVVAMSIPMLDTALAIVRRKLMGRPFDVADRGHIHHRLLDRGLTNWQALWIVAALCLMTGAAATASTLLRNDALAWICALSIGVVLVRTRAFGHHEFSLVKVAFALTIGRLVDRLWQSTAASRRYSQRLRARTRLDDAWKTLVDDAGDWQVRLLELTVESAAHEPSFHRVWSETASPPGDAPQWSWVIRFDDPGGASCQLRVLGRGARLIEPWHQLQLVDSLEQITRLWLAQHPAATLPHPASQSLDPALGSTGGEPAVDDSTGSAVVQRPQKRPALRDAA